MRTPGSLEHHSHHRTLGHAIGDRRGEGEACSLRSGSETVRTGTPPSANYYLVLRMCQVYTKTGKLQNKLRHTLNAAQQEQNREQKQNHPTTTAKIFNRNTLIRRFSSGMPASTQASKQATKTSKQATTQATKQPTTTSTQKSNQNRQPQQANPT